MAKIVSVKGREILDSRANPTVEAEILLDDGSVGRASVPSGASTGKYEARELRDTNERRYCKKGVLGAVKNVNEIIAPAIVGMQACDGNAIDQAMISLDGMKNKSTLGANATLAVSIAVRMAAADSLGLPLYAYLSREKEYKMPVPMLNLLNGGAHASNNLDIQEFMIVPHGIERFGERIRAASEIYHTLREILLSRSLSVSVGDEGGFAPNLRSDEEAVELLAEAIVEAGYEPGKEISIALDIASSEWQSDGSYLLPKRRIKMTSDELCEYLLTLISKYPIVSIEDGMGEEDIYGWQRLTERLGNSTMLVGDDLFVTDTERVRRAGDGKYANAVLIKPNQIGTLSEAAQAISVARSYGYKTVMSHRSGETEDTSIADLAVAYGTPYVKMGAPARGERTAKYNRLMKIEEEIEKNKLKNPLAKAGLL
ncbi:MAG: phosphopyruvate hydratase [Clostridia bacterium]|nr:phosphopyruvate hydratase [Clostridia bacterium]